MIRCKSKVRIIHAYQNRVSKLIYAQHNKYPRELTNNKNQRAYKQQFDFEEYLIQAVSCCEL